MFDGKFQYLKTIHISFLARKFILFENNEKSYFWRENSIILLLTGGPVFGQNEIQ